MPEIEQSVLLARRIMKHMVDNQADLGQALALLTESGDVMSDMVIATEMYKYLNGEDIRSVKLRHLRDKLVAEINLFRDLDVAGQQNYLSVLARS